jgi:hypothetical protein
MNSRPTTISARRVARRPASARFHSITSAATTSTISGSPKNEVSSVGLDASAAPLSPAQAASVRPE